MVLHNQFSLKLGNIFGRKIIICTLADYSAYPFKLLYETLTLKEKILYILQTIDFCKMAWKEHELEKNIFYVIIFIATGFELIIAFTGVNIQNY